MFTVYGEFLQFKSLRLQCTVHENTLYINIIVILISIYFDKKMSQLKLTEFLKRRKDPEEISESVICQGLTEGGKKSRIDKHAIISDSESEAGERTPVPSKSSTHSHASVTSCTSSSTSKQKTSSNWTFQPSWLSEIVWLNYSKLDGVMTCKFCQSLPDVAGNSEFIQGSKTYKKEK